MKSETTTNTPMKMLFTGGFWARVIIVILAGFIFMQKDINFQVHVQSPLMNSAEDEQPKETGEQPKLDNELSDSQSESSSKLRGLSASLFGLGKKRAAKKAVDIPIKKQPNLKDVSNDDIEAFIERFSNVAVSEMRKFGIPASITLANGLSLSAAGKTDFSKEANNFFQIPCNQEWDGMMKDFDGKCFRQYENAWAGFRDHSNYVNSKFGSLKKLGTKDYKAWAKGLEKGVNKPQKGYEKHLISIIEKYDLDRFDQN